MKTMAAFGLLVAASSATLADTVSVTLQGSVAFNGIPEGPLTFVQEGDSTKVTFELDSDNFFDVLPGDLRNYTIDSDSFFLNFAESIGVDLAPDTEAYFTIVDGFPVSDGFILSTSRTSPGGVPLSLPPNQLGFDLGYEGTTLDSLDILDALGTYEFAGLTRFNFTLWQRFPDNVVMEIDFSSMVIESTSCIADIDGDGELTLFDFLAFQNLFDAGDLAADFDGDGSLTLFDFLEFQNAFDAGCE